MQLYKLHSHLIRSHLHLIMSHNFSLSFNVGPNHFSFAFNSVPKMFLFAVPCVYDCRSIQPVPISFVMKETESICFSLTVAQELISNDTKKTSSI